MNNTICSGGLRMEPVTFKFLKDKNVRQVCEEYNEDIRGLFTPKVEGEGIEHPINYESHNPPLVVRFS